jgi:hypothetical protein
LAPVRAGAEAPATAENDDLAYEVVSRRAYELWVARGRPEGQSQAIWHEAEEQLCAQHARQHAQADRQVEQVLRNEAQRSVEAFLPDVPHLATQFVPPAPEGK